MCFVFRVTGAGVALTKSGGLEVDDHYFTKKIAVPRREGSQTLASLKSRLERNEQVKCGHLEAEFLDHDLLGLLVVQMREVDQRLAHCLVQRHHLTVHLSI